MDAEMFLQILLLPDGLAIRGGTARIAAPRRCVDIFEDQTHNVPIRPGQQAKARMGGQNAARGTSQRFVGLLTGAPAVEGGCTLPPLRTHDTFGLADRFSRN